MDFRNASRLIAICALLAACSTDDGGDAPIDVPIDEVAGDTPANPPVDEGVNSADSDLTDGPLSDGASPDGALPDMADMLAEGLAVGERGPDFRLADQDGNQRALSDFRGEHVLVVGASSW